MEEEFYPSLTSEALKLILFAMHAPTEAQYAKYEAYTLPELSEAIHDLNALKKSVHNGDYAWTEEDVQNVQAISKAMHKKLKELKDKKKHNEILFVRIWTKCPKVYEVDKTDQE